MHIPTPLLWNGASIVVKVFIFRLEKTVDAAVGFGLWSHIRAEQDTVSILQEEAPRGIRLAPQFTNACRDIHIIVWTTVKQSPHPPQVLSIAAHMRPNEGSIRVTTYQVCQIIHNMQKWRIRRAGGSPIRVFAQLFPTFI